MADATGFLHVEKKTTPLRPAEERVKDWKSVYLPLTVVERNKNVVEQATRCMDCGVPYCHADTSGCPLGNMIPLWNDLVRRGRWDAAIECLHATNNFPEFTGQICPAPCEAACVLSIGQEHTGGSVAIKRIEETIIENAWERQVVKPVPPVFFTGKTVAVIGSGPAGLAAAQQLTRVGHTVTVYEAQDRLGGLLRYGIPHYKIDKTGIDRRIQQMREEGTNFVVGQKIGVDISFQKIKNDHDAVILAIGAGQGRTLDLPNSDMAGIHLAMDYLTAANKDCEGDGPTSLSARGKNVVIVGGGDTGADCLGTAHRHKAKMITQLDYNPQLMEKNDDLTTPWPLWPMILRQSTSHEEGGQLEYEVSIKKLVHDDTNKIRAIIIDRVRVHKNDGVRSIEFLGREKEIPCDLLLLAIGFTGVEQNDWLCDNEIPLTPQQTVSVDDTWMTQKDGVFACGDATRGASLVVWAIAEGRSVASAVDTYLQGSSQLPAPVRVNEYPAALK